MQPLVINLQQTDDPKDAVHRAVAALAHGKVVAIPTETVYGLCASALNVDAVRRLFEIKSRANDKAFTLAIKSAEDALDYVPSMPPLARRFARRCWPGPVTLVVPDAHPDSVISRLPPEVQQAVVRSGYIGLRVPAHDAALQILRLTVGPLVLTSANLSGEPDAVQASKITDAIRSQIDLVLDDGTCKFGQSSSVVKVHDNQFQVLREGVVSTAVLTQLSQFIVLIVCTGNTCRSPMAERLLQQKIAQRLGCTVDQLGNHGVQVQSAGIAAFPGGKPSREAVEILKGRGIDLGNHLSQPLTDRLIRHADLILTMTNGHRTAVIAQWPEAAPRTFLLSRDHQDVGDPIGQPLAAYKSCADEIDQQLDYWAASVAPPASGDGGTK